uniref:Uncharacterized protein n=1 Tax=Sander lucioperca TaxID=283035 RepID=A0A8D0DEH3_SANLU
QSNKCPKPEDVPCDICTETKLKALKSCLVRMMLSSEDQFLCSICLDVLTDPVSTPCGHNFCKNCITDHWNISDRCQCPLCNEAFTTRPDLRVNTLFSEMQQVSKPGEVPCDVCTGTKLKALNSCLVCLVSYCETHLEPHLTMSGLKRNQLIDPVENLEGRMCTEHDKPLELFCQTDQTCVCMFCPYSDHKMHDVVPLKEEYEGKKVELGKTEAEIQQMIQKRRLKIQEVKHSVNLKKQAEAFIRELEQEISELMKRSTEVEQVLRSEDHLHLLQSVQSLNIQQPPPTKDWTEACLLAEVQQYAVDVTLDPDTAHPKLILSDDGKRVNDSDVMKNLPDNPERFSRYCIVLGKQSFSSGRFYFEVKVKGKTNWDLGVARESIDRKGRITTSPKYGNWTIVLRNKTEYIAAADPQVRLYLKSRPQKVGVFVDYEEGLVSFYDIDAAALIYSFTGCSFTEKLFPYFCPCNNDGGKNSAPLIISPVRVN